MLTRKRAPNVIRARFETAQLLKARGWSYSKIGRFMKRHHTSVLNWYWREGVET